jgi:Calcineurin-like phosphoesterase
MSCRLKKIVSVLCLVVALGAAAFLPAPGYAETLRFVFLADSRGTSPADQINTSALNAINTKILSLSPRPSFVLFGGDMAYRACLQGAYYFQAWKDLMQPLTAAGIKVYTVLGNHELYNDTATKFLLAYQQEYQRAFTDNPRNGPLGYDRLVYSFESPGGDAFFAVLDPYFLTADVDRPNTGGTLDEAQLTWLTSQIAQTRATHKFLFIHTPYYYVTRPRFPVDATYTHLWQILDKNRFDLYFCGHSHLYARKTIDCTLDPKPQLTPPIQWENSVVQVITGTCGAPVTRGSITVDKTTWHVLNAANTYYFSVVDIDGGKVQVTSYGGGKGDYVPVDSFPIN